MNTQMAAASQFKDLNEFLAKHSAKNEQKIGEQSSSTHTRIPDKDQNIYAGSYIIVLRSILQQYICSKAQRIFDRKTIRKWWSYGS
jgi:hypothetical protein